MLTIEWTNLIGPRNGHVGTFSLFLREVLLIMVMITSESDETLIAAGNLSKEEIEQPNMERNGLVMPSEIYLSAETFRDDDDSDWEPRLEQRLQLPITASNPIDEYLRLIPGVADGASALLSRGHRVFSTSSVERILYVGQAEVAHATSLQCDIVASDKATTCHILAFRSSFLGKPLVSLAHIDSCAYETCISDMLRYHRDFHFASEDEEKKEEGDQETRLLRVDVHLVGGFNDDASREISAFVIRAIATVAHSERGSMRVVLKTCVVSSMNDTGKCCPVGRGLAIDINSGDAFLAKVENEVTGPVPEVRSARIWSGKSGGRLSLIHDAMSSGFYVEPFSFKASRDIRTLLSLRDDVFIRCTSTSPEVEEDGFCNDARNTLRFMCETNPQKVFGIPRRALRYRRVGVNGWIRIS